MRTRLGRICVKRRIRRILERPIRMPCHLPRGSPRLQHITVSNVARNGPTGLAEEPFIPA
jgi:hypothetical protein